eukprot:TRINITY_DN9477_c0_g1_i1.p1 TRINITY_DN9477_c0_g1~~TRINITY_DN9477_c0_g1_i1.p1  ORF type:complete len:665 (+),score=126.98 TRINITY_DN9477_c0_g1_i1:100-2094(+)
MPLYEEKLINPLAIRFTQEHIRTTFRDGHYLDDTLREITCVPGCKGYDLVIRAPFPHIEILRWRPRDPRHGRGSERRLRKAHWFTLDNRRLYCLQHVAAAHWPKRVAAVVQILYNDPGAVRKFDSASKGGMVSIAHSCRSSPVAWWDWETVVDMEIEEAVQAVDLDDEKDTMHELADAPQAPAPVDKKAGGKKKAKQAAAKAEQAVSIATPPLAQELPRSKLVPSGLTLSTLSTAGLSTCTTSLADHGSTRSSLSAEGDEAAARTPREDEVRRKEEAPLPAPPAVAQAIFEGLQVSMKVEDLPHPVFPTQRREAVVREEEPLSPQLSQSRAEEIVWEDDLPPVPAFSQESILKRRANLSPPQAVHAAPVPAPAAAATAAAAKFDAELRWLEDYFQSTWLDSYGQMYRLAPAAALGSWRCVKVDPPSQRTLPCKYDPERGVVRLGEEGKLFARLRELRAEPTVLRWWSIEDLALGLQTGGRTPTMLWRRAPPLAAAAELSRADAFGLGPAVADEVTAQARLRVAHAAALAARRDALDAAATASQLRSPLREMMHASMEQHGRQEPAPYPQGPASSSPSYLLEQYRQSQQRLLLLEQQQQAARSAAPTSQHLRGEPLPKKPAEQQRQLPVHELFEQHLRRSQEERQQHALHQFGAPPPFEAGLYSL